jgi:hypothetical protein
MGWEKREAEASQGASDFWGGDRAADGGELVQRLPTAAAVGSGGSGDAAPGAMLDLFGGLFDDDTIGFQDTAALERRVGGLAYT